MKKSQNFSDVLGKYVYRSKYSTGQLAELTGVPKRTIANWLESWVKKPQKWQDVVRIAAALHLSQEEASELFLAAGHHSISELWNLSQVDQDRALLSLWAQSMLLEYLHQLKPPPKDFVGRVDEINQVIRAVEDEKVDIVGIFGIGGVGKTALGLKIAETMIPRYPDGQIYLDLKGSTNIPMTVAEIMAYIIRSFQPEFKVPQSESELKAIYYSSLQSRRTILFLDNAIGANQISNLVPPQGSLMIVSSRQHFLLPNIYPIHLGNLSPQDSVKLLLAITQRIGDQVEKLADLCGYLPLALRLAGSVLAGWRNVSVTEYIGWLSEEQNRLKFIDTGLELCDEETGIESSLKLSYESLEPTTQKSWSLLSIFPGDFDTAGMAALWSIPENHVLLLVSRLVSKSLVEWNGTSQRYNLHDLTRLFAAQQTNKNENLIYQERLGRHYLNLLRDANIQYKKGDKSLNVSLRLFDIEWPNIKAGLSWALDNVEGVGCASLFSEYLVLGIPFFDLRVRPGLTKEWLEIALDCSRKIANQTHEAFHLKNLARTALDLGELKLSLEYSDLALGNFQKMGDKREEGAILGNMGLAYNSMGNAKRALEYFKQHLSIATQVDDDTGRSDALSNIGMAYRNLGKPEKSIRYFMESLKIAREKGNRVGEGATLNDLGNAYLDMGALDQAIDRYKQALNLSSEIGYKLNESNALGNLGLTYKEKGDARLAIDYFERALSVDRELGNRLGEEITLGNLGEIYRELGDFAKSITFSSQALAFSIEIGDQLGEADALRNKSLSLGMQSNYEEAIHQAEEALRLYHTLSIENEQIKELNERLVDWKEIE